MPSSFIAKRLPEIDDLKRLCQSLAMLDAIMSPEWQFRYYSFNSKWAAGEEMASMRNGSGDDYFILFTAEWVAMKGFLHESPMTPWAHEPLKVWLGVLDEVPKEFSRFLRQQAFSMESTTVCLWRRYTDKAWQFGHIEYPPGNDVDGAEELFGILMGDAGTYQQFALEYYEKQLPLGAIEHVYAHRVLTEAVVAQLNAEVTLFALKDDIAKINYSSTL